MEEMQRDFAIFDPKIMSSYLWDLAIYCAGILHDLHACCSSGYKLRGLVWRKKYNIIYRSRGPMPGMSVVTGRDGGFIRQAGLQIFLILFLLQLCAASARMWRTIDTSWGFTLREDNSTCVYRNSIHALSALWSAAILASTFVQRRDRWIEVRGIEVNREEASKIIPRWLNFLTTYMYIFLDQAFILLL